VWKIWLCHTHEAFAGSDPHNHLANRVHLRRNGSAVRKACRASSMTVLLQRSSTIFQVEARVCICCSPIDGGDEGFP